MERLLGFNVFALRLLEPIIGLYALDVLSVLEQPFHLFSTRLASYS
jgi:hypothetical protein